MLLYLSILKVETELGGRSNAKTKDLFTSDDKLIIIMLWCSEDSGNGFQPKAPYFVYCRPTREVDLQLSLRPGVEPGSPALKASMLPLGHHGLVTEYPTKALTFTKLGQQHLSVNYQPWVLSFDGRKQVNCLEKRKSTANLMKLMN